MGSFEDPLCTPLNLVPCALKDVDDGDRHGACDAKHLETERARESCTLEERVRSNLN